MANGAISKDWSDATKRMMNTTYLMDCLEGMRALNPKSIDVIVTSPPYNIGTNYNHYNDALPRVVYIDRMKEVAAECKRILKDEGSLFLNIGNTSKDPWISADVARTFRSYFVLQNQIAWVKSIALDDDDSRGHYKPMNSGRYLFNGHEPIFHFTKKGDVHLDKLAIGVPYQDKSNVTRWSSVREDARDRGTVWFIPYPTKNISGPHPASFPRELPMMCIKLHGYTENTVVLDPFMGIGSTANACRALNVKYIGFDIDPDYVELANQGGRQDD